MGAIIRDCENCIHMRKDGCEVWECEYVSIDQAKEIIKAYTEVYGKVKAVNVPKGE